MSGTHKSECPLAGGQFVDQNTESAIVAPNGETEKSFATMAAQFAIKGHTLHRSYRADDGRVTYLVGRWGQCRSFNHWHDVQAFLTQIGGAK